MNTSDALNTRTFFIYKHANYSSVISDYYTRERPTPLPLANGVPMDEDEYIAKYGGVSNKVDFIPTPIHETGEMDRSMSAVTIGEMMYMLEHNVPFSMRNNTDVDIIISLLDNYINDLNKLAAGNDVQKTALDRAMGARHIFAKRQTEIALIEQAADPRKKPKQNIVDMLRNFF